MIRIIFRSEWDELKKDFIVEVSDAFIRIYFFDLLFGAKGDLVFELNDERIKKSELDTIVATGGLWENDSGSGPIHARGVHGE